MVTKKLKEKLRNQTGRRRMRPINTLGYVLRMGADLPFADIQYRRWHLVVQEVLGWRPSQGTDRLPRRGYMHENEERKDEEIDGPDWDDRIDSVTNKPWIEKVTGMRVGRIKVIE